MLHLASTHTSRFPVVTTPIFPVKTGIKIKTIMQLSLAYEFRDNCVSKETSHIQLSNEEINLTYPERKPD